MDIVDRLNQSPTFEKYIIQATHPMSQLEACIWNALGTNEAIDIEKATIEYIELLKNQKEKLGE